MKAKQSIAGLLFWTALVFFSFVSLPAEAQMSPYDRPYDRFDGLRTANPPPFYHFSVGVEGDFISRDIVEDGFACNNCNIASFPQTWATASMNRVLARIGFSPIDNLEIYGVAGGNDLQIDEFDGYNANMVFAYGGGIHWIYYQFPTYQGPLDLFADFRYLRFRAKENILFFAANNENVNETITWNEYVLKLGISGRRYLFEPYGGMRFSTIYGKDNIPTVEQNINLNFWQDNVFGLFVGSNIYFTPADKAFFFIEAAIIDEYSVNLGVRVRF